MGMSIRGAEFHAGAAQRFACRLRDCIGLLAALLDRPSADDEPLTLGAELEVQLIDVAAQPALAYEQVAARAGSPRVVPELTRYNLELNASPLPLAGRPFSRLAAELLSDLQQLRTAGAEVGVRPVPIGILPTIRRADLSAAVLSSPPRFQALNRALQAARGGPRRVCIEGPDRLDLLSNNMAIGGATAAFQVHLRVPIRDFVRAWNAALLAAPLVLAVSPNSPILLGHRLWQETRIPLIEQYTDDRPSQRSDLLRPPRALFGLGWLQRSPIELYEEDLALFAPLLPETAATEHPQQPDTSLAPPLHELRLHNSTIWRWNRPVYSNQGTGHLRLELRALPAGPSVPDMVAEAAFFVGLILGLVPEMKQLVSRTPFEQVRAGFYRAAQHGLAAELPWPAPYGRFPQLEKAADLALRVLPVARAGLLAGGVDTAEIDAWLALLRERVERGLTGAMWQLGMLQRLGHRRTPRETLARLVDEYTDHANSSEPLTRWPAVTPPTRSSAHKR